MPYDLEFPTWILDQRNKEAALGQSLGRNILEGLKFQESRKQQQFENSRWESMAPLREAQLGIALAQQKSAEEDAKAKALAAGLDAANRAAMREALQIEADISSSPNGWANPDAAARIGALVARVPSLGDTTWYQRMTRNLDVAKAQDFELKKLQEKAVADLAVASVRAQGAEDSTAAMKNTEATIQAEIAEGKYQQGSPEESARRAELMRLGGKGGARPTDSIFQKLNAADIFVTRGNDWNNKLDQYEQKYGPNALQSFIGPADVPIQKAMDMLRKRSEPAAQDALDLLQEYQGIFNASALITSGQNVTANELMRKEKEIGTTVNQNFTRMFRNYLNREKENFRKSIVNYKSGGYVIPKSFEFTAEIAEDNAVSNQQTPPRSGGFKLLKVTPLQ